MAMMDEEKQSGKLEVPGSPELGDVGGDHLGDNHLGDNSDGL